MSTRHRLHQGDARDLGALAEASVHLVVTSPPYPMIAMWDDAFRAMSPQAAAALEADDGPTAFEAMHLALDAVWAALWRVVVPGGLVCVNIGDATRSVAGRFQLYSNQARTIAGMTALGFTPLPDILWRKPTNAPNKFMGSGMLPAGAYVTYEHEYILLFRRGDKRTFSSPEDKARRARSAYFWEERNIWFSDLWQGLSGVRQELGATAARKRSAAFPFEIPWRLVHMFSLQGDTVLDPFAGTGTTLVAAAAAGRNSVGVEHDGSLAPAIAESMRAVVPLGQARVEQRLALHRAFIEARIASGKVIKNHNTVYDMPVITRQEATLELPVPVTLHEGDDQWTVDHGRAPTQVGLFG